MKKHFIVSFILLSGCSSNSYMDFYTSYEQPQEKCLLDYQIKNPTLHEINDFSEVIDYESHGYCVLGKSEFNGSFHSRIFAIDNAKKIGASKVLVLSKLKKSEVVNTSVILPTVDFSYTRGNVYTPNGSASFNSTTTEFKETQYNFKEIKANWDQIAIYLAPLAEKPKFGVDFDEVPNTPNAVDNPVKIRVVYKGSKAEKQGIKVGDTVNMINGKKISSHEDLYNLLRDTKEIKSIGCKHEKH